MKTATKITKQQHQTHLNINLTAINTRLGLKVAKAVKPSDMGLIILYTTKIGA